MNTQRLIHNPHLYINKVVRYIRQGKEYQATLISVKLDNSGFFGRLTKSNDWCFIPYNQIKAIES